MTSSIEYTLRVNVTGKQLRSDINEIWLAALQNPEVQKKLGQDSSSAEAPFKASVSSGTDPHTVTLLISLATAGIKIGTVILIDVWTNFILPKLKKKYGEDVFTEKRRL